MSLRVAPPAQLTSATLSPTADGFVFNNTPPSVAPLSPARPMAPMSANPVAPPPSVVLSEAPMAVPATMMAAPMPATIVAAQPAEVTMMTDPVVSGAAPVVMKKSGLSSITPMSILIIVFTFCIIFMILSMTEPNMVTDLEKGVKVLNKKKLFFWTLVFTVVLNVLFWIGSSFWYRK